MRYPIAIEPGDRFTAWGVAVPDLPGCFSAGDTLDEAIASAPEAIVAWMEANVERLGAPPSPSTLQSLQRDRRWRGWVWAVVDVDLSKIADRSERINITMSRRLLRRVDAYARKVGETRSGLLARGALTVLAEATPSRSPRPRRR